MSTDNIRPDRLSAAERARRLARSTARKMAIEDGAAAVTRPLYAGSQTEVKDVEPLSGFRAAHELELGARSVAHSYITRCARNRSNMAGHRHSHGRQAAQGCPARRVVSRRIRLPIRDPVHRPGLLPVRHVFPMELPQLPRTRLRRRPVRLTSSERTRAYERLLAVRQSPGRLGCGLGSH
jgi:hypothetical protein